MKNIGNIVPGTNDMNAQEAVKDNKTEEIKNQPLENENKPNPITLEELKNKRQKFLDLMYEFEIDLEKDYKWYDVYTKKQQLLFDFIKTELEKHKNEYSNIFQTTNGSIYFVLDSGESYRIKYTDSNGYDEQPICDKIFFVDSKTKTEIEEAKNYFQPEKKLLNKDWKTFPCKEGVFPIEFGIERFPKINFSEKKDYINISGDEQGSFASGIHIGHSVIKEISLFPPKVFEEKR